jgi:hypothetical protein
MVFKFGTVYSFHQYSEGKFTVIYALEDILGSAGIVLPFLALAQYRDEQSASNFFHFTP